METPGLKLKGGRGEQQTCMVSKRTNAWTTRRLPSFGPPRPRCPSIARILTIRGGVTSEYNDHLNIWFGDVLALSRLCRCLVYGFIVSALIVFTSPLEGSGVRHQIRMSEIRTNAVEVSLSQGLVHLNIRRDCGPTQRRHPRGAACRTHCEYPWAKGFRCIHTGERTCFGQSVHARAPVINNGILLGPYSIPELT